MGTHVTQTAGPRSLTLCLLIILLIALPTPQSDAGERTALTLPAIDARLALWKEWLRYQAGITAVPAISFAIVEDQRTLATGATGFANPAERVPASPDTLYSICSISKLFTATGLMQLREAGRLQLDDPISMHLPWFEISGEAQTGEPITVRGLLTHSSGLPRESDFPYWSGPPYPFPSLAALKSRLSEQEILYPASRYFQYSNLGFSLAGEILASLSGRSFDEYLRDHVLHPLGMHSTFHDLPLEQHGSDLALGFSAREYDGTRTPLPAFQTRAIAPAAGLVSSAADLARFAKWQFRTLSGSETDLLRESTLREMHRVHWIDPDWESTWGLGYSVVRKDETTQVRHGGGCPGYYTEFRLEPEQRTAAIVLSNAIGAEVSLFAGAALDLLRPVVAEAERHRSANPALAAYAGIYDTHWGYVAIANAAETLLMLPLSTRDPAEALETLHSAGVDTFRRQRDDNDMPGETIFFERAGNGSVVRMLQHSNWSTRIADLDGEPMKIARPQATH